MSRSWRRASSSTTDKNVCWSTLCTSICILHFAASTFLENHLATFNLIDKYTCHLWPVAPDAGIAQTACWGWVRGAGLPVWESWGCWQLATCLPWACMASHFSPGLERKVLYVSRKGQQGSQRKVMWKKRWFNFLIILPFLQQVRDRLIQPGSCTGVNFPFILSFYFSLFDLKINPNLPHTE